MSKIPFYENNKDDYNHYYNNYHPESFDLLNYYQAFENDKNKQYDESKDSQDNSNDLNNLNNTDLNDVYSNNQNPDL